MADRAAHVDRPVAAVRGEQRSEDRRLMPARLRFTIYSIFGGVWLTGCAWWALREFFVTPGEFGATRHPWESTAGWLHGVLAVATTFLFGWVMARHGSEGWQQYKRRASGGLLAGVVALLTITGFALFFVADDDWQLDATRIHEALGLLVTVFAVEHWRTSNGRHRD